MRYYGDTGNKSPTSYHKLNPKARVLERRVQPPCGKAPSISGPPGRGLPQRCYYCAILSSPKAGENENKYSNSDDKIRDDDDDGDGGIIRVRDNVTSFARPIRSSVSVKSPESLGFGSLWKTGLSFSVPDYTIVCYTILHSTHFTIIRRNPKLQDHDRVCKGFAEPDLPRQQSTHETTKTYAGNPICQYANMLTYR